MEKDILERMTVEDTLQQDKNIRISWERAYQKGISWEEISWEGISWEGILWEGISREGI